LLRKKRNQIQHALTQDKILKELAELPGTIDLRIRDLLQNTLAHTKSVERQLLRNLDEFVEKHKANIIGEASSNEGIEDIIRFIYGEKLKDPSLAGMGQAVKSVFDLAHKKFRTAGGIIGKLQRYFPQRHDSRLVGKVDFEEWYTFLSKRLDRDRMINAETGLPFNNERLREVMHDVYMDIKTDGKHGLNQRVKDGKIGFGKGNEVSERRANHRFFHFKDSEQFLEYNRRFGSGDDGLVDQIFSHINSMSRDIGMLEKMGPRPRAMYRALQAQMVDTSFAKRQFTDGMFNVLDGSSMRGGSEPWVRALGVVQNFLRSSLLGAAPLSAISDTTFIAMTAGINGLSGTRAMRRYLSLLNPLNVADRELARRMGYTAEILSSSTAADARFAGETISGKASGFLDRFSRRSAQFTNRASGLQAMTKAAADAVSLEFQATVAENLRKGFKQLDNDFANLLSEFGIGQKEWDIIRQTNVFQDPGSGAKFIRPDDVLEVKGIDSKELLNISGKFDDVISRLRAMATNEPDLRTQSIQTAFGQRRDSVLRGFVASPMMFKSFPLTVLFQHFLPAMARAKAGKPAQLLTLIVATTVMGGVALQAKQISRGKTPKDWEKPSFIAAALLQGGGLGLFGDFFLGDYSRFGRSPITEAIGPNCSCIC